MDSQGPSRRPPPSYSPRPAKLRRLPHSPLRPTTPEHVLREQSAMLEDGNDDLDSGIVVLENDDKIAQSCWVLRRPVTPIAILGGTSADELKQKLDLIAPRVVDILRQDQLSHVRLAALRTIEDLSQKRSPEFQEKYHQLVLPALVSAMHDSDHQDIQDIQAQAASALVCFSEKCTRGALEPYLNDIMPILIDYLQNGRKVLKERALQALAFLADSNKDHIQKHYDDVMPHLKASMIEASEENNKALLAASLNCTTMVWMAVGKENIRNDIHVVVQQLKLWQESEFCPGDPMRTALLQAWGRICRCLGQEFQSHMPSALRFLLASAGCTSSNVVDQRLALGVKVISCNALCLCAAGLKGHFHPWISEVAATLVPLLEGHSNSKAAAVSCMYSTLRSYEDAVEEGLFELNPEAFGNLDSIIRSLLNAFEDENSEIKMVVAKSISVCAQYGGSVFGSHIRAVISCFITVMEKTKKSCKKKLWLVHDNAASALGKVLQFHGDKIESSEVFNTWLNHLPLKYDREEAKVAHYCLCLIVEKIRGEFCDTNNAILCRIMAIYAEILWGGRVIATEGIVSLIIDQGKRFRERFRGDGWNSIMSSVESRLRLLLGDELSS